MVWKGFGRHFLKERIEWEIAEPGNLVYQYPMEGKEIRFGHELVVREAQSAVITAEARTADRFLPGKYALTPERLPELSASKGWRETPPASFCAEVYYVMIGAVRDLPWKLTETAMKVMVAGGTATAPVTAEGSFSIRIDEPERLVQGILSGNQIYETEYLLGQFRSYILGAVAEALQNGGRSAEKWKGERKAISKEIAAIAAKRFAKLGIALTDVRLEKAETAREARKGEESSQPKAVGKSKGILFCAHCGNHLPNAAKFCPECGRRQDKLCQVCQKPVGEGAKFCGQCGAEIAE